jgi:hypothetical protein
LSLTMCFDEDVQRHPGGRGLNLSVGAALSS